MRFHTNLPVTDIEKTIEFYRILFDAEPVKVKPDYVKFLPPSGGLNISFHHAPDKAAALRDVHLGFELPSVAALDAASERLERAGLISVPRETGICCYANQDKLWVTDPSGYRWELYYLVEDTAQKIAPATSCCAPAADTGAVARGRAAATSCCG